MELYTNSQPTLISDKVVDSFSKMIKEISDQNTSIFRKIYDNVIYPNLSIFIVVMLIIIFLLYRYFTYVDDKPIKQTETFSPNNIPPRRRIFDEVEFPNERITRPTFNPAIPVSQQQSYVNYLPDEVPVRVNGELVDNTQDINYYAPPNNPNTFQYSGPYYKASENGLSDDMYKEFVSQNNQNLSDLNDIIRQKNFM